MVDYHLHTYYSGDSSTRIEDQLAAAFDAGIEEICFTDHIDFDAPVHNFAPAALDKRHEELLKFGGEYKGVRIKEGAEISMAPFKECAENSRSYIAPAQLDFIIGSVHSIFGANVYDPDFYRTKSKHIAYLAYLDTIRASLPDYDFISVLGHYDFVAKYAPYPDRSMSLTLSNDINAAFADIFKSIINMGKGIELNTAAWRGAPHWGLDILKLYRSLGGEFITLGSDAHRSAMVGNRLDEAYALVLEAGIPYYATFDRLVPTFHPIKKR